MGSAILELLRVRQWAKNVFVLAPLFFSSELLNPVALRRGTSAFIIFCLLSSAIYIFNDWCDLEADKNHAKKSSRPLPSGILPVPVAFAVMVALLFSAALGAYTAGLPRSFVAISAIYLVINVGYSVGLKHLPILELFLVASGYVIRLIGGATAAEIILSPWIIVATGMLALLMTTGKRHGDIAQENDLLQQRRVAVGTPIAERPPPGSRRALLTHRALPSGSGVEAVTGQRM
jgi:4-hydroxybenzoate polyprenyltransferase